MFSPLFYCVWLISIDFLMLYQPYILRINLCSWWLTISTYSAIRFANVLFTIFASMSMKRLVSSFFFLQCPYWAWASWLCWPQKTTWVVNFPLFHYSLRVAVWYWCIILKLSEFTHKAPGKVFFSLLLWNTLFYIIFLILGTFTLCA